MYTADVSSDWTTPDATGRAQQGCGHFHHGSTTMKKTTMKRLPAFVLTGLSMLVLSPNASAQYWGRGASPASGACFYEDINFGGRYFCTRVGDSNPRVPSNINDEISSIRLFGDAEIAVFRDDNMRGEMRVFNRSVRDMRNSGFNDRLTSYVVQPRGYAGGYGGYNGGAYGGRADSGYYGSGYGRPNGAGYGQAYPDGSYRGGATYGNSTRWTYPQAEAMVRQGYRRVLGREPDPGGARSWVNEVVRNNWSQRQLEAALRDSPEARGR
jgi:Peptidase inhibitor family I36